MAKLNQAIATLRAAEAKANAYDRGNNEGGEGYNPHQAEVDAALNAVVAVDNEAFAAEWTAEVFAARRAVWNAEVGKYKGQAVDAALIAKIETATGIKIADMRRAKELHG